MFTDRILRDYCRQIREVEEKMEAAYRELVEKLTHPEYKSFFARLVDEERGHQGQIDSIISLFNGE
jgi:rubrerythrin